MRLPATAHTSRPWRIHELTRDFEVEDVWALPTPGGPDDFPRLVREITAGGTGGGVGGALLALRMRAGRLLRLDGPEAGIGGRVASLRERMPDDLREAPTGRAMGSLPFEPLYLLGDEYAAEIANRTMHGVIHLGWVRDGDGYRGQMAILVKRNGRLGTAYMAAIKPFRYLLVYPLWLRRIERRWSRQ